MLLPQSSAFAALKNRLNSVSSIGYLHIAPRPYVPESPVFATCPPPYSVLPLPSSQPQHRSVVEQPSWLPVLATSPRKNGPGSIILPVRMKSFLPPSRITTHDSWSAYANTARSNATTPSATNFDRPNRLKGREDGIIRWGELLEKFRAVQERARRLQRPGSGDLDDSYGVGELRIADEPRKEAARPAVPAKDPPTPAPPTKPRSGLGRQFGRLGGAVAGRGKRT